MHAGYWQDMVHQLDQCSRPLCDNKGTVRACKLWGSCVILSAVPPLVASANARLHETKSICGTVQHSPLSKHRYMGVMTTVTASTLQATAILTVLMCHLQALTVWILVTLVRSWRREATIVFVYFASTAECVCI